LSTFVDQSFAETGKKQDSKGPPPQSHLWIILPAAAVVPVVGLVVLYFLYVRNTHRVASSDGESASQIIIEHQIQG